jgi:hypothetical protein
MTVRRTRLYTFIFLSLLALQQSCGTNSDRKAPIAQQIHDAEQAASSGNKDTPATPESNVAEDATKAASLPKPKEILPESILAVPERDLASPGTKYDTVLLVRSDTSVNSSWEYRKNQQDRVVGFEFSNRGGNRILPHRHDIEKALFFTRDFQFRFDDRARQDIHLFVSDWGPSRDKQFRLSELMNSVMLFFPRNYLPAIASSDGRIVVTLPTGEKVEFDAQTHEVLGGALSEAPVDLNADKAARKFAGIEYIGKGLVVRANARGTDPRLGTTATVITGSPPSDCEEIGCTSQCRVPSKELWDQHPKGAVRFKFSTDEEFDAYLLFRCGFGVPKNIPDFVITATGTASPVSRTVRPSESPGNG